ncbi:uncharacterized protein [Oscarella lobularis]|uniref:uncharacterized protein isoform X2 n=1 Tax=Oscarella lobularis TaxID=121494 RepID=UPI0033132A9D
MNVLRYLLVSLHDRLPLGDGLITNLCSNGLMKGDDVEQLKHRGRDEAIDCLVTEILPFADPALFPAFCKALQAENAEHALRPIRAVVETIVPHFQGIPPEMVLSSSVIIIVDIRLRESFYREFPAMKDHLFPSVAVELVHANLTGFYRNACMSTQNTHTLNRKLVIITEPPTAKSQNLCDQIANLVKIDRNIIAYHHSWKRAWKTSQPSQCNQSSATTTQSQSQVMPPSHSRDIDPYQSEPNVKGRGALSSSKNRGVTLALASRGGEESRSARHGSLPDVRQFSSGGMILRRPDEFSSLLSTSTMSVQGGRSASSSMTWQTTLSTPIQEEKGPSSVMESDITRVTNLQPRQDISMGVVASLQKPVPDLVSHFTNLLRQMGIIKDQQEISAHSLGSGNSQGGYEEAQRPRVSRSAPVLSQPAAPPVERQLGETESEQRSSLSSFGSESSSAPIVVEQPSSVLQCLIQESSPNPGLAHGPRSSYSSQGCTRPKSNTPESQAIQQHPKPSQSHASPSENSGAHSCTSYVLRDQFNPQGSLARPDTLPSSIPLIPNEENDVRVDEKYHRSGVGAENEERIAKFDSRKVGAEADELIIAEESKSTDRHAVDTNIYKQALASGSVPINRYRVMVVGQDGGGKSCLIDSFLGRPFKAQNPSTDGIAIHVAVTAAEGKAGQHTWHKEEYEKAQHLDKYLAAGYVITKRQHQETLTQSDATEREAPEDEKMSSEYREVFASDNDADFSSATRELDRRIEEITKDENLTAEQQKMFAEYLQSSEALAGLENFEVSSKLLWDLGGQERYLTSHAALIPTESEYTVCMYLLVIDISKPLGDEAESSYRLGGTSADVPLELLNIKYNRDFPRHWFTSIGISHPSDMSSPYLGEGEDLKGVSYPAVLIAATHIDKVAKMPNCEEFLKSQNDELDSLIRNLRCEDHIVKNPKNGQWFFRVDNTKAGQTEDSKRCEGVKTIISKLDGSSKHYWSQKLPMPVTWVRFELFLVLWKFGKIIYVETAIKLAKCVGIESKEGALSALKFFHNLGVIFYFWDVPELANFVVVDPTWLINTVAKFVTAREPTKVMHQRRWRKLCETGKFSTDMVMSMLTEAKVDSRDQKPVLDVLRMLDILCDPPEFSSSTFFIPCMLSQGLSGPSTWEKYCPSEAFPPPIVVYPNEVQTIPEALFFRIVTKFTREYAEGCDLTRNRCLFRIGNSLVLELLYYNRGACLIVSLNGEGDKDEAKLSVPRRAPGIQQFVTDSVINAKKRGMSGLELAFYYQVSECIRDETSESADAGNLSCKLPGDARLVKLTESCNPARDGQAGCQQQIMYKSETCITREDRDLVYRWYINKKENLCFSEPREILKRQPTTQALSNPREETALQNFKDEKVEDKHLREVYFKVKSYWKRVARQLGPTSLSDSEIGSCERSKVQEEEQCYAMLQTWMKKQKGEGKVWDLASAIYKSELEDVVKNVYGPKVLIALQAASTRDEDNSQ